jgi:diguanylate cyclase (GGDEF)-like protein/PAS domain S-box-containing protein
MNDQADGVAKTNISDANTKTENRRTNTQTRDAIDAIQELLFDPEVSAKIFELVLGYFQEITKSEKGVCFVSGDNAEFPIHANSKLTALANDQEKPFINSDVLATWVGQKNILNTPIFYNTPIPVGAASIIAKDANLSGIMVLPIVLHSELRAICVLGSEVKNYTPAEVHKLMPIIGAVMCTLQSAESVRGNFLGLDQKIADNRYLSSLISSSPLGVIVVKSDFTILLSNPSAQDMFYLRETGGQSADTQALSGMDVHRVIPNYESLFQWSNQQARYGSETEALGPHLWEDQKALRYDGSECSVNLTIFRYSHGTQRFTTLQIQDNTLNQKRTEEYKRTTQELNALTQLAPVAIIRVSKEWECSFANDKWYEFTGLTPDESTGADWINAIHSGDVKDFLEALRFSMSQGVDHSQEIRLVSPIGATKWVDFNLRILISPEGVVEGFLGTCADVTERYINQEKLRHIAEYDGLTGLANRVLFQDRLQQAFNWAERDNSLVNVFFLDLDGFKDVNDSLGHNIGDILLQKVAERLVNALRKNDTVARFGGDEFVVLLGIDDHLTEVMVVANKVIQTVAQPYLIEGNEIFVTTSLGIAQGNHKNANPDILLKNADFALYKAKREGKNKIQLFNEELEAGSAERATMLNSLRKGLKEKRFLLHYQAICNSTTKQVIGFESLLRFNSEEGDLIYPDRFIPTLEETRMIIEVGRWVIDETCRQLSQWQNCENFPEDGYLAFNVSAKQLLDDDLVQHIAESCKLHGINPSQLVMEMTESVFINKPERVKGILHRIKALGLRLALDDFGTGYSSLSYLQNYPFDIIKIDKSFIDDLSTSSNDTKIVKAIIALASSLELVVVAEGVESAQAGKMVEQLGAHLFQGYHLSKPIPSGDVPVFLEAQSKQTK